MPDELISRRMQEENLGGYWHERIRSDFSYRKCSKGVGD